MSFVHALELDSLLNAWKRDPRARPRRISNWDQHRDRNLPFSGQEIAAFRESLEDISPISAAKIFADIDHQGEPLPENLRLFGLLPDWCLLHIPHDATEIPARYRGQFALSDEEIAHELVAMTDAHTAAMFGALTTAV